MSCDPSSSGNSISTTGFPTATAMGLLATNLPVVWEEICAIQQAILAASNQSQPGGGKMCTTVAGTTPMTFVSGVTLVTVIDGGAGYFRDSPAVAFIPPVGVTPSAVATATVTTNGGNIMSIDMVSAGSGYEPVPATMSVSSPLGINADLRPLVDATGTIAGVNIANGGTGYTTADSIIVTRAVAANAGYVNAVILITAVSITGEIISIAILNPGSGYQDSVTTVQIVSSLNPLLPYPIGGSFIGTVLYQSPAGQITSVLVNNTGSGYSVIPPYLIITDPGTGATTSVTLGTGATSTSITSIVVTSPGTQYTQLATGTVMNPPTAALPNPPTMPAIVRVNMANNTFGTNPYAYWAVWAGTTTNKAIQMQLNSVQTYFVSLGYTVTIQSNPATGSTIQWKICW